MDEQIRQALERDQTIDITTIGRRTGQPRRIEIWFQNLDGDIFITGTPGPRDWYANLLANPAFTFHLKETLQADLPACAEPVTDRTERHDIFSQILQRPGWSGDLATWVWRSPLVRVRFDAG